MFPMVLSTVPRRRSGAASAKREVVNIEVMTGIAETTNMMTIMNTEGEAEAAEEDLGVGEGVSGEVIVENLFLGVVQNLTLPRGEIFSRRTKNVAGDVGE